MHEPCGTRCTSVQSKMWADAPADHLQEQLVATLAGVERGLRPVLLPRQGLVDDSIHQILERPAELGNRARNGSVVKKDRNLSVTADDLVGMIGVQMVML